MKDIIEILAIFILPVFLFIFKIVKHKYIILVLLTLSVLVFLIGRSQNYTWQTYGIRTDNLTQAFWPYLIFTFLGLCFIVIAAKKLKKPKISTWWKHSHFTFLFLPISIFQEFLFRGYLMPRLESMLSMAWLIILINTLLYTFIHIFYNEKKIVLPLTFLAGICFAGIYYFYPNLILISVSHSILNFFVVLYSFFTTNKNPQEGDFLTYS